MINFGLNSTEIKKIHSVFYRYDGVEKAILYGSRAKGNYRNASDIDLSLVGKNLTLTIQQRIENDLDDLLLPYKFDISIFHTITNNDLLDHIKRVGKVFFEKERANS